MEGIPLMSKKNGRYKNVNTFNGKGYEDMSTADVVLELLNMVTFSLENLLKLSIVVSSIFVNFITVGKIAIAKPINNPKNTNRLNRDIFLLPIREN